MGAWRRRPATLPGMKGFARINSCITCGGVRLCAERGGEGREAMVHLPQQACLMQPAADLGNAQPPPARRPHLEHAGLQLKHSPQLRYRTVGHDL